MKSSLEAAALLVVLATAWNAHGHPGRTAADGCHYCRTNCDHWGVPWDERHCHGGSLAASRETEVRVQPIVTTPTARTQEGHRVTRVIDGDTIEVEVGLVIRRVRLVGIDTPETKDPRKPVECFGQEAAARMNSLVGGRTVRLEKDPVGDTVDRYGRLLRYVYSGDRLVNAEMIRQGYARAYLHFPFTRRDEFREHEREARERERGLWARDACGRSTSSR